MIGIRKSGDVNSHLSNADLKVTDVVPGLLTRRSTAAASDNLNVRYSPDRQRGSRGTGAVWRVDIIVSPPVVTSRGSQRLMVRFEIN